MKLSATVDCGKSHSRVRVGQQVLQDARYVFDKFRDGAESVDAQAFYFRIWVRAVVEH